MCQQPLCTKKYKKTSIESIAQHHDQCAAHPLVKQWEAEREQHRLSQLQFQRDLHILRQQLREVQRQKEELQRHNAFLIQQATTTGAAQAALFNPFLANTAYHQHYHQYSSTHRATNPTACPPPSFGPLPKIAPPTKVAASSLHHTSPPALRTRAVAASALLSPPWLMAPYFCFPLDRCNGVLPRIHCRCTPSQRRCQVPISANATPRKRRDEQQGYWYYDDTV